MHAIVVRDVVRTKNRIRALYRSCGVKTDKAIYAAKSRRQRMVKLQTAKQAAAMMLYEQWLSFTSHRIAVAFPHQTATMELQRSGDRDAFKLGGERTAHVLTLVGTCVAHGINPRAYLHLVTKLIVAGWPQSKLRDLLPDRLAVAHPELALAWTRRSRAARSR